MPLNQFCKDIISPVSGVPLSAEKLEQFSALYDRVLEVNSVMNITSLTDMCDVALKHFADSLTLAPVISDIGGKSIIDFGCGGGFPGLPLKIALPDYSVTMLDSTEKKVRSVEQTAGLLGLSEMHFVAGRAEELAKKDSPMRERYDFAVSRAVARLNVLCELCLPFVRKGGYFLAMKGAGADEELKEARSAVFALGGKVERVIKQSPDCDEILSSVSAASEQELERLRDFCGAGRSIIAVRKVSTTGGKYPRAFAAITKKPL